MQGAVQGSQLRLGARLVEEGRSECSAILQGAWSSESLQSQPLTDTPRTDGPCSSAGRGTGAPVWVRSSSNLAPCARGESK